MANALAVHPATSDDDVQVMMSLPARQRVAANPATLATTPPRPPLHVAERRQAVERLVEVSERSDHHVELDDRFGAKAGHRRAAHMLDSDREVAQDTQGALAKPVGLARPMRVIGADDERLSLPRRTLLRPSASLVLQGDRAFAPAFHSSVHGVMLGR
jgi:hypothetical protein